MGSSATWIVDDADLFLSQIDGETIHKIASGVASGAFRLVWIRNRLVNERHGWYAEKQRGLALDAICVDLAGLDGESSNELAAKFIGNRPDRIQRQSWLSAWSGGMPGLMFDLAPYIP